MIVFAYGIIYSNIRHLHDCVAVHYQKRTLARGHDLIKSRKRHFPKTSSVGL